MLGWEGRERGGVNIIGVGHRLVEGEGDDAAVHVQRPILHHRTHLHGWEGGRTEGVGDRGEGKGGLGGIRGREDRGLRGGERYER